MRWLLGVLIFLTSFSSVATAHEAAKPTQPTLSLTILPDKNKDGSSVIDRDGSFHVLLTNKSHQTIRIWGDHCQPGYENLSFQWNEEGERPTRMQKRAVQHFNWRNTPPQTVTIPPQSTHTLEVDPSAIWGERVWLNVPEPNSGKRVSLIAVFEIGPSADAAKEEVWTGKISSEPIKTLVVDPELRTPLEYFGADCPRRAIKLIEADPKLMQQRDSYQRTALHLAASGGFVEAVAWLLTHGAEVDALAINKFTPLHMTKDPKIVKLLLAHKANINAKNVSNRTALEEAASEVAHVEQYPEEKAWQQEKRALVKVLLESGADYDIRSAAYLGDAERVRALLNDKTLAKDKETMRAAAQYGRASIVKMLLDNGAEPEDADYGGLTLSYFAVQHPEVLKLLFAAGANPKIVVEYSGSGRGPSGSTLLHEAAEHGAADSVKLLLEKGLDINAKSPGGYTPLCDACRLGRLEVVDVLLKHKADLKIATNAGWTPMGIAAEEVRPEQEDDNFGFQAVIRTLERSGVELDIFAAISCDDLKRAEALLVADPKVLKIKNANGMPALHKAVTLDRREIAKLLLAKGCDPDIRSDSEHTGHKGETSLLNAAFWGRLELADLLIQKGAKVNSKAEDDVTPLHEAARMKHVELARLLLKHGADVNAKDKSGETPRDWANLYAEDPDMTRLLKDHGGRLGRERAS